MGVKAYLMYTILQLVAVDRICIWAACAGKTNWTVTRNFYLELLVIIELLLGIVINT